MWGHLKDLAIWAMWTVVSWWAISNPPDSERPGDDDQFARWLDEKEA